MWYALGLGLGSAVVDESWKKLTKFNAVYIRLRLDLVSVKVKLKIFTILRVTFFLIFWLFK